MEAGFAPRSAFKLVNTVLLLAGGEQHPAALDAGCIDLYTGALEVFKLGAAPTFVMGEEGIQVLKGRPGTGRRFRAGRTGPSYHRSLGRGQAYYGDGRCFRCTSGRR